MGAKQPLDYYPRLRLDPHVCSKRTRRFTNKDGQGQICRYGAHPRRTVHDGAGTMVLTEEKPAHRVFLPAYYIDRNLVTWADYLPFIQTKGPEGPKGEMYLDTDDPDAKIIPKGDAWVVEKGFEKLPASEMAWSGALAYCRWKRKKLPSEAQWEKAARGGDSRLYPWGNQKPSSDYLLMGDFRGQTAVVGSYPKGASPYGVNDMAGQVWEWTASLAMNYPYKPKDGRESLGAVDARVVRGGNSASAPDGMTATNREVVMPGRQATGHGYIGFRCAAEPPHST